MECIPPRIGERENKKQKKRSKTLKQEEEEEKEPAGKAKKIRLFPTPTQRATLTRWFGTTRWTYNQCLSAIEKEKVPWNKKALRAKCLNAEQFQEKEKKWVLDMPYDVRDEGMNDLLKAYKTNFAVQKKSKTPFKMKYRSKKNESESIVIHAKHWKKAGMFHPKAFGKEPIRASEPLPDKLTYDCRLQRTRLGEFYLCLLMPLEVRGDNQAPSFTNIEDGIIALDPGVRTFMTGYSPSGLAVEWGKKDIGRIYRLCRTLDELQSKWTQKELRHRRRYKLKRAARRLCKKIHNLVDELHKKLVKWLVEQYHTILLPEFETQNMVIRRANRRIGSKTARAMLTWSHYRFKQRLLDKTREYPWCNVVICDEHYTSKTCGNCGFLHQKLGSSKSFKCPRCATEMDRDVNAARNILLRYFTLNRARPSGLALGLTPSSFL
jgi:putative transposase